MLRLNYVHNGLNERWRREELAIILSALHCELHQKILIDSTEHITAGSPQDLTIKNPQ